MRERAASERFGKQVKLSRVRRGMTQRQLADLANVGIRTLRDLEAGRTARPHPVTVRLLCSALGISEAEVTAWRTGPGQAGPGAPGPRAGYQVPQPVGETIGRDDAISALCELFVQGHRLVTLTGFPGVGKTRLASHAAGRLRASHGWDIRWIARAGQPGAAGPDQERRADQDLSGADVLADAGDGPVLVVIDGALPRDSRYAERLAATEGAGAAARVLTTSRCPLGIPLARVVPVPPLMLPVPAGPGCEVSGMSDDDAAMRLLLSYVTEVQPRFRLTLANYEPVAELCRRVDGIPSLLNLIATTFLLLDPAVLLECLTADPAGTLDEMAPGFPAVVREMVGGLGTAEAALLWQLAGLENGWSVAQAADSLGVSRLGMVRRMQPLFEAGLIRPCSADSQTRFQVLELVRRIGSDEPAAEPA